MCIDVFIFRAKFLLSCWVLEFSFDYIYKRLSFKLNFCAETLPLGHHLYLVLFDCIDSLLDDLREKLLYIAVFDFATTEFNWNPRPLPAHTQITRISDH